MPPPEQIAKNLVLVRHHIAAAANAAGRRPEDVRLVAVSKAHPPEAAEAALTAGHRLFGENRVQESETKWPALKERFPDARLHLIGPLQRNKARAALELFDVIETVDRPKLATHLARLMDETGRRPRLPDSGQHRRRAAKGRHTARGTPTGSSRSAGTGSAFR